MNYFVLNYRYAVEKRFNLGDNIQSIAAELMLRGCGIPKHAIGRLNRDQLALAHDARGILVVQGWFGCNPGTAMLPVRDDAITPLFFGFHLNEGSWEYLAANANFLASMKRHAPIGCRDFGTRDYLRSIGVPAYYSGCLTLTLPKRARPPGRGRIYLIDPLGDPERHRPSSVREDIVRLYQEGDFPSGRWPMTDADANALDAMARQRLEEIRDRASLVITRRIHVALPCLAMGVPVVFTFDQADNPRVSMLAKLLPIHSSEELSAIDWRPPAADVESEKERISALFRYRLQTLENRLGIAGARLPEAAAERAARSLAHACAADSDAPVFSVATFSRARFIRDAFTPEQFARIASGTPLVLFGAGAAGVRLRRILRFFDIPVAACCDNAVRDGDARRCEDLPVIGFRQLLAEHAQSVIFISALGGFDAIAGQLSAAGIPAANQAGTRALIAAYAHFVVPANDPIGAGAND